MPRRGENIYKRKDGRWEGRYLKMSDPGQKKQYGYVYGKSYKEAKAKQAAAREAQKKNLSLPKVSEIQFSELADRWLGNVDTTLKKSTVAKYRNILKLHLLPRFGQVRMTAIKDREIEDFRNELLTQGGRDNKGFSPKYVADILSLLKVIQKYAVLQNPEISCRVHDIPVKRQPGQLRVLGDAEQQRLYQYLMASEAESDLGILLSMFTGLRIGEICALRWEDIDLEEKLISVCHTMQRIQVADGNKRTEILITAPKSICSMRQIPIPSIIYEKLWEAKKPPSAYLLTGREDVFIEPRTMQNHFRSVADACTLKNATFHTLRHTFATRCVAVGCDVKTISEILGHADVNTTLNRYVHPTMNQKRQNMSRLSDTFAVK